MYKEYIPSDLVSEITSRFKILEFISLIDNFISKGTEFPCVVEILNLTASVSSFDSYSDFTDPNLVTYFIAS